MPARAQYVARIFYSDNSFIDYDNSDISANPTISKSVGGQGFQPGSVSVGTLSITVPNGNFPEAARIGVSCSLDGGSGIDLGTYYITSRQICACGDRVTLTCSDACGKLEHDFVYTGEMPLDFEDALTVIAQTCGVTIYHFGSSFLTYKFDTVLTGSCRRVLEIISASVGGIAVASGHNSINIIIPSEYNTINIARASHAPLTGITRPSNNIISVACMTAQDVDTLALPLTATDMKYRNSNGYYYSPTYSGGSKSSFCRAITVSTSQVMADRLYTYVAGFNFGRSFSCSCIKLDRNIRQMDKLIFEERPNDIFRAAYIQLTLSGAGVFASVSATADVETDTYLTKSEYDLMQRIKADRVYAKSNEAEDETTYMAGVSMGSDGLCFWREEEQQT
jgi:hypothetical protein